MLRLTPLINFLIPSKEGIPVLMYHEIHPLTQDTLTVKRSDFSKQMDWLVSQNYQSISLSQFLSFQEEDIQKDELPQKPILLTFDDGYRGIVSEALPLLVQKGMKACLFVTSSYIQEREANEDSRYLSLDELQTWVESGMEIALHSHAHPNYRDVSVEAIVNDLIEEEVLLRSWKLPFEKALAYPFGARPKEASGLHKALADFGIRAAFRIGNRISPLTPKQDIFEIRRIDIRGTDSFFEFQIKVKKGRIKPF